MAECKQCGKDMGFADRINAKGYDGKCISCTSDNIQTLADNPQAVQAQREAERLTQIEESKILNEELAKQQSILEEQIDTILLTTETATNLKITKRIEIVTAECAFGMNIFKDLFAGVRDIVGGRSEAVQKTMRDARRTALYELKREAHLVGANAVVGVDLDYVELSSAGSMIMLVASGTAVVIEE